MKSSIRTKLALALAACMAFIIAAGAFLTWTLIRDEIKADVAKHLFALVSEVAVEAESDVATALKTVAGIAEAMPAAALDKPAEIERFLHQLPSPLGWIGRCAAAAPDGRILAHNIAAPAGAITSLAGREYFQKVLAEKKPVVSAPLISGVSGTPAIALSAPRLDADGQVRLVVTCGLVLTQQGVFGHVRELKIGNSGYLYVATRDRRIVLHPDARRMLADSPPRGANPLADRAGDGFEGAEEGSNSQGLRALMSFRQIPSLGWFVAAVYPVEEAYQSLHLMRERILLMALAALALSAVLAWYLAGWLVAPLTRLTLHLGQMRQRPEARMQALPARDDEIGELAEAFNGLLTKLRQREDTIRLSEEKFFKAFHSNPDFTMISRLRDGLIVEVNEGFERLLGISAAEAVGRLRTADLHMWADPADRDRMVRLLSENGRVRDLPAVFLTRSGERREVEISASTIDLGGEPHIIGTARDVTELKQSQEALRRSEERFAMFFRNNPDYATVSRLSDGKFVDVNRAFETMTGWQRAEVVGRTAKEIGLYADPQEREWLVGELKARGVARDFEFHFRMRSGEVRLVQGAVVKVDLDGEPHILGVARDITEIRSAEAALRKSEEKFSKIFHASPDWILVVRVEDGMILDANESFALISGHAVEEAVGRTVVELGLWAYPEKREAFVRHLRATERVSEYEWEFRLKDGSVREGLISSVAIDLGGVPCLISIVRDITDQRRAEAEIRSLNVTLEQRVSSRTAELEAAVREMESFSYSISHDLRAPLRAIAGYAKIIEEDYAAQINAEGKRLLDRIAGGAIRMGELIDDLLDFSRIGRAELRKVPIEMNGLVREVLGEMPEAGSGHNLQMRVGALPEAVADRGLMRQVWANLLANAIKYSRQSDPAIIEIGGAIEAGEAHFFVRDNGVGFDMQYADKLFQVFQRLHRDPVFEGTGVGLAIVARVVQRHGGRVWAEGEPDRGATFHFSLPQA
ncbi:MAG: PAS domain S-box protein [Rhodocyclales bacterium]|nr:PAS domain S-box protein [Rhodocyclales bacterium]